MGHPPICCKERLRGSGYSARRVIEGSTWAARQAGNQHAIAETAVSSAITESK